MKKDRKEKIAIRLNRDYWAREKERFPQGAVIDVDIEQAKRLFSLRIAERADPLPGEIAGEKK